MLKALVGKKIDQAQEFLADGTRIAVTRIWAGENYVVVTSQGSRGGRVTLGFDTKKHITKSTQGILKKAGIDKNLRFFREVTLRQAQGEQNADETPKAGTMVVVTDVLKPGDVVQVMGVSKGKGFQGGVKLHHFKGGPRTHGQSDRERAPGSIGQTTTPGRVYKGKRMAARMGSNRVTVTKLEVMDVSEDVVTIKGLVPGGRNSLLVITKTGEDKKFVPLYRDKVEEVEQVEKVEEVKEPSSAIASEGKAKDAS